MPERKIEYQRLEKQRDTGFLVKAPSWQRLYTDAALCLTDLRVQLDRVSDGEKRTMEVVADGKETLMTKWLTEVLDLFQKGGFLPKRVVFTKFDGKSIQATLWGEIYNRLRHGSIPNDKTITCRTLEMGELQGPEPSFFVRVLLVL